jgi:heme/copper-type cytochrome/quinol oxidase subunit 2
MGGRAGKTRNIFLVWLVWPVITLGIYYYVWWYKINREARDFDPQIKVEPALSVLAVLLGWLIIVPPFVSTWRTGDRIAQMQRAAGLTPTCQGWIGLVLMFVFSLQSLYYQAELNKIWAHLGYPLEGAQVTPVTAAQG